MKRYIVIPIILLTFLFSGFLYAENAQMIKDRESKEILKNIRDKEPNPISVLEIQDKWKWKFSQEQKNYEINIWFDSETKKVILKKKWLTLSIELPHRSKNSPVKLLDGQVISSDEYMDIVTQSIDGGVRQLITIHSVDADRIYDFPLTLPEWYNLLQDGSWNISIKNNEGKILSSIVAPWAKDANGINIPTHYEVLWNTLRQYIDFDANTAFPVVADPAWCGQSIASTSWINRSWVWSLSITPTACWRAGILGAGGFNVNYSWQEVLSLTPVSSLWNKAYGTSVYWSMYDQYACHANFVLLKPEWNLGLIWNIEPSRPNVGYATTVLKGCNP